MKGPYSILLAGKGNMMRGVSLAYFGNLLVRMVIDVYMNILTLHFVWISSLN